MLKPRARAGGAAPIARIEAKRSSGVGTLDCHRGLRENRADRIKCTDETRWVGTRRFADGRLINEHHIIDVLMTEQQVICAGRIRVLPFAL